MYNNFNNVHFFCIITLFFIEIYGITQQLLMNGFTRVLCEEHSIIELNRLT